MSDIDRKNFWKRWPEIEEAIRSSAFIAVDVELTGLTSNSNYKHSLFDSGCERYGKLRKGTSGIVATQVGLSAFQYNRNSNSFSSSTYTFHICPQSVGSVQQYCTFEGSVFNFLMDSKFDFNKFAYEGLPYLNRSEKYAFKKNLSETNVDVEGSVNYAQKLIEVLKSVQNWMKNPDEEKFIIKEETNSIISIAHRINQRYPNLLITLNDTEIVLEKNDVNCDETSNRQKLHSDLLKYACGFSNVINLIEESKKPIVLHNALTDLVVIYKQFVEILPVRYDSFKNHINNLFPMIYDTKMMFNKVRPQIRKEFVAENTSLANCYMFFNESKKGKQVSIFSPSCKMKENFDSTPWFHNAGWDSYATGYCFLRIAFWSTCLDFGYSNCNLTCTEIFSGIKNISNKLYFSRGAQPFLCLDSIDPPRHRPQYLHFEVLENKPLNLSKIADEIGAVASVDVKKYGQKSALVAVLSHNDTKKILETFKENKDLKISRYNILKHSPMVKMALWSSLILSSGGLIAMFIFNK